MGPLRLFVTLSVLASVRFYTQAAPPRTYYGDTDVNPSVGRASERNRNGLPDRSNHEEVTEVERYNRVLDDGTIEFKTALSNGHVQYQRISNKFVDGRPIQVYEGYVSQRYADGTYGTSYYIADENGYRTTPVVIDINPPVLPGEGAQPSSASSEARHKVQDEDVPAFDASKEEEEVSAIEKALSRDGILGDDYLTKRQTVNKSNSPSSDESIDGASGEKYEKDNDISNSVYNDQTHRESSSQGPFSPVTEASGSQEASSSSSDIEENDINLVYNNDLHSEATTKGPSLLSTERSFPVSSEDQASSTVLPSSEDKTSSSVFNTDLSTETSASSGVDSSDTISEKEDATGNTTTSPPIEESTTSSLNSDISAETTSSLPATEENSTKLANNEEVSSTPASTTSYTEDFKKSIINEVSTEVIDEATTELPIFSSTEENVVTNSAEEDSVSSTSLPIAEERSSTTFSVESEANTDVPSTEDNLGKSSDDITTEASTTLPSVEENSSSYDHIHTSTELPAFSSNEESVVTKSADEELVSSTNPSIADVSSSTTVNIGNELTTEVPSTEDELSAEESTTLSSAEENSSSHRYSTELPSPAITEDINEKASEDEDHVGQTTPNSIVEAEASTDLPSQLSTEESILKTSEDAEASTVLPTTDESLFNTEITNEASTDLPSLSTTEKSILKISGDLEDSTTLSNTEDLPNKSVSNEDNSRTSTEIPAVTSTGEQIVANNGVIDASTVLPTSEESDTTTELVSSPVTEENIIKSVEEIELAHGQYPSTSVKKDEVVYGEETTEVPTSTTTEGNTLKHSENDVLSTNEPIDTISSTTEDNIIQSTTEGILSKNTDEDITEEISSKGEGYTTEGSISTTSEINNENTNEDIEGSGTNVNKGEGSSTEGSISTTSEGYNKETDEDIEGSGDSLTTLYGSSTTPESPITEDSVTSTESTSQLEKDEESNPDLVATIDEEYLEPITELPRYGNNLSSTKASEEDITTLASSTTEGIVQKESSNDIAAEVTELPKTTDEEEKPTEISTELDISSTTVKQVGQFIEDYASQSSSSTEIPLDSATQQITESSVTENAEDVTNSPLDEESFNEIRDPKSGLKEEPALVQELSPSTTEVPSLTITGEKSNEKDEDQATTVIPELDDIRKNIDVSSSTSDSESSTELPSTEAPADENTTYEFKEERSLSEPALPSQNSNSTKIVVESEHDLDATEDGSAKLSLLDSSTGTSSNSDDSNKLFEPIQSISVSTSGEEGTKKITLETAAEVTDLPTTEETSTRHLEGDVSEVETKASVISV